MKYSVWSPKTWLRYCMTLLHDNACVITDFCHVQQAFQLTFTCHAGLLVTSGWFPAKGYKFFTGILVWKYKWFSKNASCSVPVGSQQLMEQIRTCTPFCTHIATVALFYSIQQPSINMACQEYFGYTHTQLWKWQCCTPVIKNQQFTSTILH